MEGFDVVEDHGLGVVSGWRNNVVKTLGFESGPERFGGGVIVTVSPSTHALVDLELSQGGSEVMAGVLAALIAVVDEAGKAPSALGDGPIECFEHETGFHGVASGPSEDTAAKEVQLGGEEEPAFGGGNVSKVGYPDLIGLCGCWHLQEPWRGDFASMGTVSVVPRDETALAEGVQPLLTHQAPDAPPSTDVPPLAQLVTQSWRAVGCAALQESLTHFLREHLILQTTRSAMFMGVVIKAAAA